MGATTKYSLPYPDYSSYIAATSTNLREDLRKLATSTDAALGQETGRIDQNVTDLQDRASFVRKVATAPFEGAVGDTDGRPSFLQYDGEGLPTTGFVAGTEAVGIPNVTPGGDGFTLTDGEGHQSWLSVDADGKPDVLATTAIANALHYYVGPEAPYVYPGNWIMWVKTDWAGTPIETLIGRN